MGSDSEPVNRRKTIPPDLVIASVSGNRIQACAANQNIIKDVALKIVIIRPAIQNVAIILSKKTHSVTMVTKVTTIILMDLIIIEMALNIAGY